MLWCPASAACPLNYYYLELISNVNCCLLLSLPTDVLLSLTAAHVTGTGPHVAGILLTDAKESVG